MDKLNWLFELSKACHVIGAPVRLSDAQVEAIAEAFRALEQRAEAAEAQLERESDIHIDTAASMREWRLRAEAAEAKLAELARQEPAKEDEDGNPVGFIDWYERKFAGMTFKGTGHVADCDDAWRAAIDYRAAPAAVPVDEEAEREKFEEFMHKRFAETMDQRRSINGDQSYMAWDKGVAWLTWKQRAGIL